jgi:hypothetical protein
MPSKTLKRGSRRQVWNGTAEQTAGGLTKEQLEKNKRGRIVSKKKTARMTEVYKGSDSEEEKQEPVKGGFWESLFK